MCTMKGYDVVYYGYRCCIQQHFCRTYGDCGGGMSFKKARQLVVDYYQGMADRVREAASEKEIHEITI